MDGFPEKFGIMDFYLQVCHRARVVGCVKADLQVLDVGKSDSLAQAEAYVKALSRVAVSFFLRANLNKK